MKTLPLRYADDFQPKASILIGYDGMVVIMTDVWDYQATLPEAMRYLMRAQRQFADLGTVPHPAE